MESVTRALLMTLDGVLRSLRRLRDMKSPRRPHCGRGGLNPFDS